MSEGWGGIDFFIKANYSVVMKDVVTFLVPCQCHCCHFRTVKHLQQSQTDRQSDTVGRRNKNNFKVTDSMFWLNLDSIAPAAFHKIIKAFVRVEWMIWSVPVKDGVINHFVCQDVVFMSCQIWKRLDPTVRSAVCNMKFLFQCSRIPRTVVAEFCFQLVTKPTAKLQIKMKFPSWCMCIC